MELLEVLTPVIVTGTIDDRRFDGLPGVIKDINPIPYTRREYKGDYDKYLRKIQPYYIEFNDGSYSWWCSMWAVKPRLTKIR